MNVVVVMRLTHRHESWTTRRIVDERTVDLRRLVVVEKPSDKRLPSARFKSKTEHVQSSKRAGRRLAGDGGKATVALSTYSLKLTQALWRQDSCLVCYKVLVLF